jgi:hypothetical protein
MIASYHDFLSCLAPNFVRGEVLAKDGNILGTVIFDGQNVVGSEYDGKLMLMNNQRLVALDRRDVIGGLEDPEDPGNPEKTYKRLPLRNESVHDRSVKMKSSIRALSVAMERKIPPRLLVELIEFNEESVAHLSRLINEARNKGLVVDGRTTLADLQTSSDMTNESKLLRERASTLGIIFDATTPDVEIREKLYDELERRLGEPGSVIQWKGEAREWVYINSRSDANKHRLITNSLVFYQSNIDMVYVLPCNDLYELVGGGIVFDPILTSPTVLSSIEAQRVHDAVQNRINTVRRIFYSGDKVTREEELDLAVNERMLKEITPRSFYTDKNFEEARAIMERRLSSDVKRRNQFLHEILARLASDPHLKSTFTRGFDLYGHLFIDALDVGGPIVLPIAGTEAKDELIGIWKKIARINGLEPAAAERLAEATYAFLSKTDPATAAALGRSTINMVAVMELLRASKMESADGREPPHARFSPEEVFGLALLLAAHDAYVPAEVLATVASEHKEFLPVLLIDDPQDQRVGHHDVLHVRMADYASVLLNIQVAEARDMLQLGNSLAKLANEQPPATTATTPATLAWGRSLGLPDWLTRTLFAMVVEFHRFYGDVEAFVSDHNDQGGMSQAELKYLRTEIYAVRWTSILVPVVALLIVAYVGDDSGWGLYGVLASPFLGNALTHGALNIYSMLRSPEKRIVGLLNDIADDKPVPVDALRAILPLVSPDLKTIGLKDGLTARAAEHLRFEMRESAHPTRRTLAAVVPALLYLQKRNVRAVSLVPDPRTPQVEISGAATVDEARQAINHALKMKTKIILALNAAVLSQLRDDTAAYRKSGVWVISQEEIPTSGEEVAALIGVPVRDLTVVISRKAQLDQTALDQLKQLSASEGLTVNMFLLIDELTRLAVPLLDGYSDLARISELSRLIATQA